MAVQDARDFVHKAAQDEALRAEGRARWSDIVNVGAEHGYHFTHEEFMQAEREIVGHTPKGDPGTDVDTCFCILI